MAQPYYANSHVNEVNLLARRQQSAPYLQQLLPSLPPLSQLLEQRTKDESQGIPPGPGPGLTTQPLTQYPSVYYNEATSGTTTNVTAAPVSVVDPSAPTAPTISSSMTTPSITTNSTTTASTDTMVAPEIFSTNLMDHSFAPMLPMDIYGTDIATAAAAAAVVTGGSVPVTTGLIPTAQLLTEEEIHQHRIRHASVSSTSSDKVYSFVAIPGTNQKKRPRRRYDEIERLYHCNWPGCTKSYGTLNHLNAHVSMQKHGPKRHPSEFKEMRKEWRRQKKEREAAKKAADEMTQASMQHVYPPQLSYHLQPTTLSFNGFY